ncbi:MULTISPECIES: hypothetical protein [unclassified Methanoculleus]|jgi:hypothetical protein|nr:hypothetical protein [Methanoculleus sp. UBA377]
MAITTTVHCMKTYPRKFSIRLIRVEVKTRIGFNKAEKRERAA